MSTEPTPTQQREEIATQAAVECAASMWGYCHGGCAGATDEIRYFKANQLLPGFQHCIKERMLPIIQSAITAACEELRAENERMAERNAMQATFIASLQASIGAEQMFIGEACAHGKALRDRITALEAECKELRRDKERLDALDGNLRLARMSDGWNAWPTGLTIKTVTRNTARDAIDAALNATGGEG